MNSHQNPTHFYNTWQADSKIYMEVQSAKTIQDSFEEEFGCIKINYFRSSKEHH